MSDLKSVLLYTRYGKIGPMTAEEFKRFKHWRNYGRSLSAFNVTVSARKYPQGQSR